MPGRERGSSSVRQTSEWSAQRRLQCSGGCTGSTCGSGRETGPSRPTPLGRRRRQSRRRRSPSRLLQHALTPPSASSVRLWMTGTDGCLGWTSHDDGAKIPALPDRCPRCDSEGWNPGDKFFSGTVRSPIRAHTSGAAQSTQLYLSQLVRSMGETPVESRTIVFTDSRDDAARTAAGVGLNHYRDVIRQVTQQILAEGPVDIGDARRQGCSHGAPRRGRAADVRGLQGALSRQRRSCRRRPPSCRSLRASRRSSTKRCATARGTRASSGAKLRAGADRPAGVVGYPASGLWPLGGQEPRRQPLVGGVSPTEPRALDSTSAWCPRTTGSDAPRAARDGARNRALRSGRPGSRGHGHRLLRQRTQAHDSRAPR